VVRAEMGSSRRTGGFSKQQLERQLNRAWSADLVERIEPAVLGTAAQRASERLRRLPKQGQAPAPDGAAQHAAEIVLAQGGSRQATGVREPVVGIQLVIPEIVERGSVKGLRPGFRHHGYLRAGRAAVFWRESGGLNPELLQRIQRYQAIEYLIPDRPAEAVKSLERTIEQARAAISEGRDAVQGLRSSTLVANDLALSITGFGEGLAADQTGPNRPEFRVYVEGRSRDLPPLVRDEVYKIACESLRNAFRHAQPSRIEVQIRYDPRQFRLQIVDNGKGIDPAVLKAGGRSGHHGLPGLHERAQLAGGKLSVWSQLSSGTEIELAIPAAIAYVKSLHPARLVVRRGPRALTSASCPQHHCNPHKLKGKTRRAVENRNKLDIYSPTS
jgi:signal transduction histidine kinase